MTIGRPIQTLKAFNKYDIITLGDSQTDLTAYYGVSPGNNWGRQLSNRLNLQSCLTKPRVFGISGQTTAQILGRADIAFLYSTPTIGIIYGGVNDAVLTETGTVQTGTGAINSTTSITLKTSASGGQNALNSWVGNVLSFTGGTGSGQTATIIGFSYDSVNNKGIATITSVATPADGTTTYSIAITTQAQMQANMQALAKVLKFNVTGYGAGLGLGISFYSQTQLPANGFQGQRFVIMNDTSTTGGVVNYPLATWQNTTITGDYSGSPKQSVWEFRNGQSGVNGWGRVAINTTASFATGVSKVIIQTQNYLNWSSAGDNATVTSSGGSTTGTPYSAYAPVRAAAIAAVAAETGTVLSDLYAFQSMLINGGTFLTNTILSETTQGSFTWHWANSNQHHNQYGHETIGRCLTYIINAQSGWISSLQS